VPALFYLNTPTQALENGMTLGGLARSKTASVGLPVAFADRELAQQFMALASLGLPAEIISTAGAEQQGLFQVGDQDVLLFSSMQSIVEFLAG
jgi:hypothetical protein